MADLSARPFSPLAVNCQISRAATYHLANLLSIALAAVYDAERLTVE